jgi:hypothetical protein
MAQVISFDADTHTYTIDGHVVPVSVTDIAGVFGEDVDEAYEDAIDRAADRGVTMHYILRMAFSGEDYAGEYPGTYQPWVDAIELFLSEHVFAPISIEEPIYSPKLDIAGTPDWLGMMDEILTLPDWKFVSSICKPKVKAQLNLYNIIYNELGVFPERLMAVQFMPYKYRIYPVEIGGDEWATALKVWGIKNRKYARGRIG